METASAALRDQESLAARDRITVFLLSPVDKAQSCLSKEAGKGRDEQRTGAGTDGGWYDQSRQPGRKPVLPQAAAAESLTPPPPAAWGRGPAGPVGLTEHPGREGPRL